MKALVFGFGSHGGGFAAAKYFLDRGWEVRITDRNSARSLGEGIRYCEERGAHLVLGRHREEDFLWADIVVKSPAIDHNHPLLGKARRIVTDFSCLFEFPDIDKIRIIAITGTKGKTTTASAVAHVLASQGSEALMCGNMGISAFRVLEDLERRRDEGRPYPAYIVCELSSWQVADTFGCASKVPVFEASCLTSFFADHQNYYHSVQAYVQDKLKLFSHPARKLVSPDSMMEAISAASGVDKSRIVSIERSSRRVASPVLAPCHAICRALGIRSRDIDAALKTFPGVPHRNEMVRFHRNMIFINDSAATVPEAVEFTVDSCYSNVPLFLICGGTDKELSAEGMREALRRASSRCLLDGSFTRKKLVPLLEAERLDYKGPFGTMEEALDASLSDALAFVSGDGSVMTAVVLLSPGAASFELFKDEFDRGDAFKRLVGALE